jgi:ABC-2 type transport system permease protein
MKGSLAIARRELAAWLDSPGAWVVAAACALALHAAFWFLGYPIGEQRVPGLWEGRSASLFALFAWLPLAYVVLAPALCMASWAEERRSGSEELLLSWPIRARAAVTGKFLAAWLALAGWTSAVLVPLACVVAALGELDWGVFWCGWSGALCLCASSAAIALALSSAAAEPLVAFLLGALALGALWSSVLFARVLAPAWAELALALSPSAHYLETSARGLLDSGDLAWHAAWVLAALALNTWLVEGRRWR